MTEILLQNTSIVDNSLNPKSFEFKETFDNLNKKDKWVERKEDFQGKKVFDYTDKCSPPQKWEIVIGKIENNKYSITVKKWENGGWKSKIYKEEFTADNKNDFNKELWKNLDETIGKVSDDKRINLRNTWTKVYEDLNKKAPTQQKKTETNSEKKESQEKETKKTNLKSKPIDLKYSEKNKERVADAKYPNKTSVEWRVTRCLRFKSITDAVEDRYWIPRWLLMAMMAQEWWWDPTVINQRVSTDSEKTCDWWAWLIHIQATNAADYWLTTLRRSTNNMKDYPHWERLETAKEETWDNLAKLSKLDDRFNPVLSVDVTARYLMKYCGWNNAKTWDEWMKAVNKYAWRWMKDYWYSVIVYWATINSIRDNSMLNFSKEIEKVKTWGWAAKVNGKQENVKNCITRTKKAINNLDPSLDGELVSLDEYYQYLEWQWDNYWLAEYKKHNKEHPYVK